MRSLFRTSDRDRYAQYAAEMRNKEERLVAAMEAEPVEGEDPRDEIVTLYNMSWSSAFTAQNHAVLAEVNDANADTTRLASSTPRPGFGLAAQEAGYSQATSYAEIAENHRVAAQEAMDQAIYISDQAEALATGEANLPIDVPINVDVPLVISAADPANLTATVGQTLTCTTGNWQNMQQPAYEFQWTRNNVNVVSQTTDAYTTTVLDTNANISCRVTATNYLGNTAAPLSNSILITASPVLLDAEDGEGEGDAGTGTFSASRTAPTRAPPIIRSPARPLPGAAPVRVGSETPATTQATPTPPAGASRGDC